LVNVGGSTGRRSSIACHARNPDMNADAQFTPVLEIEGLSKKFEGIPVLSDVNITIERNQIIGIVGENGAGKTTLFNIISGLVPADAGQMKLKGKAYSPRNYRQASERGISRVFQEQALIPNIRVYENLLLSHEAAYSRMGQILDKKRMIKTAQRVVDDAKLDIDVRRVTDTYNFSRRQLIEIARACIVPTEILGIDHPVVLLDEPTSALERSDEETFRNLIRHLRSRASIVLVSHRLTEVLELSDIVYVLKDGLMVERLEASSANEKLLHGLMVGREREADYYHEQRQQVVADASVALSVHGLTRAGEYEDVSLDVRCGEIVGIGGLMNSGKSELGKGVSGITTPDSGTVALADGVSRPPSVNHFTRHGLGYVPSERLLEGLIGGFSVAWNLSLAGGMDKFTNRFGLWRRFHENEVARSYIDSMAIKTTGPDETCSSLSGGNQQKIVLARWLCRNPRILILDNPTRGVDAGAKEEIYKLLRNLCDQGVAILLITDDLLELIGLSSRILVMQNKRVSCEVDASPGSKPSERELVAAMLDMSSTGAADTTHTVAFAS